jgi:WD40 repeat protein
MVSTVAVTSDGRRVVSGSTDGMLKVWNLQTGQEEVAITLEGVPWCIALAPDGATILAGDEVGNVCCLRYVE